MVLPLSSWLNLASDFVPVGMGIGRKSYWRGGATLFFSFVVLCLVVEVASYITGFLNINNHWILHIYDLLEYVILILLLAGWQKEAGHPLLQRLLYVSIGLFALLWIVAKVEFESFKRFDQYTHTISALVLVAVSLFTLIDLARNESLSANREVPLYRTFKFWILVAVFSFFSGNTFLFGMGEMIIGLKFKDAVTVWTLHWWLNITANICYGVAFWCLKPR
jgi:hypothetical protein